MNATLLPPDAMPGYEVAPPAGTRAKAKRTKSKPAAKSKPAGKANRSTVRWATFGVAFTLILSALLNGYANAQHAPLACAGWLMGVSIPVIVLTLAKVAGETYRDGNRPVAYSAAGSGIALLALSVWHCANSISILTGSGLFLAMPLALAIDAGLVSLEVALVSEPRE